MSSELLTRIMDGEHLARHEARALMDRVMTGQVESPLLAALLVALRQKGETVDEITGFAEAMRAVAVPVPVTRRPVVDTCGTGGDGSGTVNLSTATALLSAAMGAAVAKHGNRAVSSRSGSADVLEALGLDLDLAPDQVGRLVDDLGIGFLFAPKLHPAMAHAVPVRRSLGIRTVFNVLGPLTNPAGATRQLLGVYDRRLCAPLAQVLAGLGSERAFVVHGAGGLDEVSPCGPTTVAEVSGGQVRLSEFRPEDVGLTCCAPEDLAGGSPDRNAAVLRSVLAGASGPVTDAVVLNAAFVAVVADLADSLGDGVELARATLAAGRAGDLLEDLAAATQTLAREAS